MWGCWGEKVETLQPALRASDENLGGTWASATRPALGMAAAGAAATHLVKASPRSITTAVFSPPLPRPSYSGMVVNKTVSRRTQTRRPTGLSFQGAGPERRRGAVAAAGTSRGRGAPAPGCPRLCLTPRRIHVLTGALVSCTWKEELREPSLISVRGGW